MEELTICIKLNLVFTTANLLGGQFAFIPRLKSNTFTNTKMMIIMMTKFTKMLF